MCSAALMPCLAMRTKAIRTCLPIFLVVSLLIFKSTDALSREDLFPFGEAAEDEFLPPGDDIASPEVHLKVPIIFFDTKYESLYINSNGFVSFMTDLPNFHNRQFPLSYPIIAPLYTDVDTRGSGNISYRESNDEELLQRSQEILSKYFTSAEEFEPTALFFATWDQVGHYNSSSERTNTFQVVIASNSTDSYVMLLFPDGGIQWIRSDGKIEGLPDAIAQSGIMSTNRRVTTLPGSGSEQAFNFDQMSNSDERGLWLFKVSQLEERKTALSPDKGERQTTEVAESPPETCETTFRPCPPSAECVESTRGGMCCSCDIGHIGNGRICLNTTEPIRVAASMTGSLNGLGDMKRANLYTYVDLEEGRQYTAINDIDQRISGSDLQTLFTLNGGIAWLFAKTERVEPQETAVPSTQTPKSESTKEPPPESTTDSSSESSSETSSEPSAELSSEPSTEPSTEPSAEPSTEPSSEPSTESSETTENEIIDEKEEPGMDSMIDDELEQADAPMPDTDGDNDDMPVASPPNGFTLTGGRYNRTVRIWFNETAQQVIIRENYIGVDAFKQLRGSISVKGTIPRLPPYGEVQVKDYELIFIRSDEEESPDANGEVTVVLRAKNQLTLYVKYPRETMRTSLGVTIDQEIRFKHCARKGERSDLLTKIHVKNNFFKYDYTEKVVRFASLSSAERVPLGEDTDPCRERDCGPHASCILMGDPLASMCQCHAGYIREDKECINLDECATNQHNCDLNAECSDSEGSFTCSCNEGYTGDGRYCKSLTPRPRPHHHHPGVLHHHTTYPQSHPHPLRNEGGDMLNSVTSHTSSDCSRCDVAYGECVLNRATGSGECVCQPGYVGNGFVCYPERESCDVADICDTNAECLFEDTTNRHSCVCNPGFYGDGFMCMDAGSLDRQPHECSSDRECPPYSTCMSDGGYRRCECTPGFMKVGQFCQWDGSMYPPPLPQYPDRGDQRSRDGETSGGSPSLPPRVPDPDCRTLRNCPAQTRCQLNSTGLYSCIQLACNVVNTCDINANCEYDEIEHGYRCACREGWTGSGTECNPIIQCNENPQLCDPNAECIPVSTEVGYSCQCRYGFIGNGYNCRRAPTHDGDFLLFTQGMSILRINSPSSPPLPPEAIGMRSNEVRTAPTTGKLLVTRDDHLPIAISTDCFMGHMYWSDILKGTIRRANYNGSSVETFITGLRSPEGVAIDWVSRNIFWTDSMKDTIEVARLDRPAYHRVVLDQNIRDPRAIVVHPGRGKMFWTDWNRSAPKIEVANMDGTGRNVLVSSNLVLPNGLALDMATNQLCWTDSGSSNVECLLLTSLSRRIIYSPASYPFSLTLLDNSLYWTSWQVNYIFRHATYGGLAETLSLPPGGNGKLYGITAVPRVCPQMANPCAYQNGGCEELCLPNGRGGRTCLCAEGSPNCLF